MGGRAGDAVVIHPLFLAVADDVVLEGQTGLAAGALQIPVDRHLVTRNDSAPMCFEQYVIDGGTPRLSAGARHRLAGVGVEYERNHPRLDVVAALAACPVERALLGEP